MHHSIFPCQHLEGIFVYLCEELNYSSAIHRPLTGTFDKRSGIQRDQKKFEKSNVILKIEVFLNFPPNPAARRDLEYINKQIQWINAHIDKHAFH